MERMIRTLTIGCTLFLLVCVAGCGNQYHDKLIGTWSTDIPGVSTITLNKDGTGTLTYAGFGKSTAKSIKWRLNGSNWIMNMDGKDSGAFIKSADENKINFHDPAGKGRQDFSFTRVKK